MSSADIAVDSSRCLIDLGDPAPRTGLSLRVKLCFRCPRGRARVGGSLRRQAPV